MFCEIAITYPATAANTFYGHVICAVAETCFVVMVIFDRGTVGSTGATAQIMYVPAGASVWHCASPLLLTVIKNGVGG